jgi:hypothetical protein
VETTLTRHERSIRKRQHSALLEKISIIAEIKDPVAVRFYSAMPEKFRSVYAEMLLTGAAYLATQKDIATESIRVIESTAKELQKNAKEEFEDAVGGFLKEDAPKIFGEVMRDWVKNLPNPKDYPDPEDYKDSLGTALQLLQETAKLKGKREIMQKTTEKGRLLEEDVQMFLTEKYGSKYDIEDLRNLKGALPHCKAGDFVLKTPRLKVALDATEEKLKDRDARKKVDMTMRNREADGALLVFRSSEQIPKEKLMVKVGYNKFFAYFGEHGEGTWDIAIDVLFALTDAQKRAEERIDVDTAQVAGRADKILKMINEIDSDTKNNVEERAKKIESSAAKIRDAIRSLRVEKLSAIREMAEMLLTIAKGRTITSDKVSARKTL